jgi:hypothetical protein
MWEKGAKEPFNRRQMVKADVAERSKRVGDGGIASLNTTNKAPSLLLAFELKLT